MDGADDLTQTHTGANQYLPELTFTFKTALKEQGERGRKREWSQERGRDKWKDRHALSAASIQVPKGTFAVPMEEWKCSHWVSVRVGIRGRTEHKLRQKENIKLDKQARYQRNNKQRYLNG